MELQDAIQRFEEAGLVVLPRPSVPASLRLARSDEVVEDEPLLHKFEEPSGIWYEENAWTFHRWDSTPGPGPDDISFQADSLDQIVEAALNYYFGNPITIDQWIVPLLKHPEWDAERLAIVIASALHITQTEWEPIHKGYTDRRGQLYPRGTLSQVFACLFNPIHHTENPDLTLYLRRDLIEAFIVTQQT